jgi:hypothetical protein
MNRPAIFVALIAIATPVLAQNGPTRIKTQRIAPTVERPMYQIDNDGTVNIDWERVEQAMKSAAVSSDIARVMLAIRDGSWKPMK